MKAALITCEGTPVANNVKFVDDYISPMNDHIIVLVVVDTTAKQLWILWGKSSL